MDPDFEGVFGLTGDDKIMNAVQKLKSMCEADIPGTVNEAISKLVGLP